MSDKSLFETIFGKTEPLRPDTLQRINCPNCGQQFGIQWSLAAVRLKDKTSVFCPNGHTLELKGRG